MKTTLTPEMLDPILTPLARANAAHDGRFPGEPTERQQVHAVYGGAHLFKADIAATFSKRALETIREYTPDAASLAQCLGLADEDLARMVLERTIAKLTREPVEDYHIDFEDGYGNRPDAEEDGHAISAAQAVARGMGKPGFPPFIGIRIKPFTEALRARGIRTLDLFLTALVGESGRAAESLLITLPKITVPEQVTALVRLLEILEAKLGLRPGALRIELMIEAPQAIIDSSGVAGIPRLLDAAGRRCRALHFGPYDYTASCNITAEHQSIAHPACNFARNVIQVSAAGRGLMLADGPINILPIPPHRAPAGGALTSLQVSENRAVVHRAMRLHYDNARRALAQAYYQGWDLHPGQLPTRYAAVYAFFLEGFEPAAARLRNFMDKAAQATMVGDVFDDAATGQGLLNFFLRGINCGAFTEEEAAVTGLTIEDFRGRSFLEILNRKRAKFS
jgi:citrate lyase beta subunit